jgi:hypothetical protein
LGYHDLQLIRRRGQVSLAEKTLQLQLGQSRICFLRCSPQCLFNDFLGLIILAGIVQG